MMNETVMQKDFVEAIKEGDFGGALEYFRHLSKKQILDGWMSVSLIQAKAFLEYIHEDYQE